MNNKIKILPMPSKREADLLAQFTLGSYVNYDAYMEELNRNSERDEWKRNSKQYEIHAN